MRELGEKLQKLTIGGKGLVQKSLTYILAMTRLPWPWPKPASEVKIESEVKASPISDVAKLIQLEKWDKNSWRQISRNHEGCYGSHYVSQSFSRAKWLRKLRSLNIFIYCFKTELGYPNWLGHR